MNTLISKVVFSSSVVLLSITACIVGGILFIAVYPFHPGDIQQPIPVHSRVVVSGGNVCYQLKGIKFTDRPAVVTLTLVREKNHSAADIAIPESVYPPIGSSLPKGSFNIPRCTQVTGNGKYHLTRTWVYPYWFRPVVVSADTETFTIVPKACDEPKKR